MSTLGGNDGLPPRRRALAYASSRRGSIGWVPIVAVLMLLLILKNMLFTDYRQETVKALKEAGRPESEIERFVPKTATERAQYVKDKKVDYQRLKEDVAFLLSEVDALKAALHQQQVGVGNTTVSSVEKNGTTGKKLEEVEANAAIPS